MVDLLWRKEDIPRKMIAEKIFWLSTAFDHVKSIKLPKFPASASIFHASTSMFNVLTSIFSRFNQHFFMFQPTFFMFQPTFFMFQPTFFMFQPTFFMFQPTFFMFQPTFLMFQPVFFTLKSHHLKSWVLPGIATGDAPAGTPRPSEVGESARRVGTSQSDGVGWAWREIWVCLKIVYPYTQWLMIIIPTKWL